MGTTHFSAIDIDTPLNAEDIPLALGNGAVARIPKTANLAGPLINRKDNGEAAGNAFEAFGGAAVVLFTREVDLKSLSEQTLSLPAGCKFFVDETGLILTEVSGLSAAPSISFGWTGNTAGLSASGAASGVSAVGDRKRFTSMLSLAGLTSLVAAVTAAATATTMKGRFYFRGLLVEDE